ncbi:hypothetical protein ElyMa_000597200 [Elysia marginata]|uniref:Uncharacterized protein n=1 Tax=Elysia marginata TaxID=1093978 RepID=A0AAV4G7A9_9GAST|nr:hypothetical protein ElyMa_000597200 [Elysia marginata]
MKYLVQKVVTTAAVAKARVSNKYFSISFFVYMEMSRRTMELDSRDADVQRVSSPSLHVGQAQPVVHVGVLHGTRGERLNSVGYPRQLNCDVHPLVERDREVFIG